MKQFETPIIEIAKFNVMDIITTSQEGGDDWNVGGEDF